MRRKSNAFSQAIVGIFMVTVLLLLGYFTIVISGVDLVRGKEKTCVQIAFAEVGGLKDHDNVMYRGTKVGTVESIAVTPSNLVVTAYVDRGIVLRRGYRARVCSLSMLGGTYLQLDEGVGELVDVTGAVLQGEMPGDWMNDVSQIARNLKALSDRIEQSGIMTNIEAATASARAVAERVERGEGLLGKLTSQDDALYEDIRATAANARSISAQLNREKLYEELQGAIADFRKTCGGIETASVAFRKTCGSINRASDGFAKAAEGVDLKAPVAKATALMDNLNTVAERLKGGEGTLGRLLSTDDKLYREVNGLIHDVRQMIDNYRDTTPISTFSSLAVGAF